MVRKSRAWKALVLVIAIIGGIAGYSSCSTKDASAEVWPVKTPTTLVAPVFGSGMVLQRNTSCIIWGNTMQQTSIRVKLEGNGSTDEVVASIKGDLWKAVLPAKSAGGTYKITISGNSQNAVLDNLLFGEVWVASGQSNMLMEANGINGLTDAEDYLVSTVPSSTIRFCSTNNYNLGSWTTLTLGNLNNYSCVATTFACKLYENLQVPVGIVQIAEGNTYIQSWMSEDALNSDPDLTGFLDKTLPGNQLIDANRCYNTYVAKVLPMSMKGVIWYQGENNANVVDSSTIYSKMLTAMIGDMRTKWGMGNFPFLIVQLPKFQTTQADAWCGVREAQLYVQSKLQAVGTAITIDKGNINPNPALKIHPTDKLDVGTRLSLLARKMAYGGTLVANSPVYKSSLVSGNKITVVFDVFGSTLTAQSALTGFEICGADNVYVPATATLTSTDTVELTASGISNPKAARYCWASNPVTPTLFNDQNLPAAPFQTDSELYATQSVRALKMEIHWNSQITANDALVARMGLSNTGGGKWPLDTIYSGEKLSYEVYIPSDGNYIYGMGAMDGQSPNLPAYWIPASMNDQRGQTSYTQLDEAGKDRWIKRSFTFPSNTVFWHLGLSVITDSRDKSQYAGKTSTLYYRNIKIESAGGNRIIYNGTTSLEAYPVDTSLAGKASSVNVTDGVYNLYRSPPSPQTPIGLGTATEYRMDFLPDYGSTALPGSNAYNWYGFQYPGAFSNVLLKNGDKLAYRIFIPSNTSYQPGMGLIDLQNLNWSVLTWQPSYLDQNGKSPFVNLVSEYGVNHWINLEYTLPAGICTSGGIGIQHIGIRNNFGAYLLPLLNSKTACLYFSNVRIIHQDGSISAISSPGVQLYNVNSADDYILPFANVATRTVNEFTARFTYPVSSENIITLLDEQIATAAFISQITPANGTTMKVINADGVEHTGQSFVGTGSKVEIYVNNILNHTYSLLIFGDVDGDGLIGLTDLVRIRQHILKTTPLSNLEYQSADLLRANHVGINELLTLKKKILGIGTISQAA